MSTCDVHQTQPYASSSALFRSLITFSPYSSQRPASYRYSTPASLSACLCQTLMHRGAFQSPSTSWRPYTVNLAQPATCRSRRCLAAQMKAREITDASIAALKSGRHAPRTCVSKWLAWDKRSSVSRRNGARNVLALRLPCPRQTALHDLRDCEYPRTRVRLHVHMNARASARTTEGGSEPTVCTDVLTSGGT
eukprot:6183168-Pleurochrysis_carterae.AAC.2